MDTGNLFHAAGTGVANPELDGIGSNVDEGEALPVDGPDGIAGTHAGGKRDVSLLAIGDSNQFQACGTGSDAVAAASIVLAVILGLDTSTGEAQERRGHASDGGVVLPRDEENSLIGRAYEGDRRRGRAHDGQDIVRRQVVAQGIGRRRRRRVRLSADGCRGYPGKKHAKGKPNQDLRTGHKLPPRRRVRGVRGQGNRSEIRDSWATLLRQQRKFPSKSLITR